MPDPLDLLTVDLADAMREPGESGDGADEREVAASLLESGWRPPARVIETAQIPNEPTGTVLRSTHGDVGSVDHGGAGEWPGHNTKVHFLDFAEPWWEFVMHLPPGQWAVLWQPGASDRD
ncbi:hypothetical protein [Nocardia sp. NPDC004711]